MVAGGVIVGSAMIHRIADLAGRPPGEIVAGVGQYASQLIAALP